MGKVYLIHFDKPLGNPKKKHGQAQHYIGYTEDLKTRLEEHERGNGAKIMAAVSKRGIPWKIVRVWTGDGNFERKLKNRKNAKHLCPLCRGEEI